MIVCAASIRRKPGPDHFGQVVVDFHSAIEAGGPRVGCANQAGVRWVFLRAMTETRIAAST